ncbi:presequence protease, mitochondrial-like, partial [Planoprotostelium fungivorum]
NPLHAEIREKGGAYGSGANSGTGVWSFYSYRDPNTKRTLDTFDKVADFASSEKCSESLVKEMKLSLFGSLDRPTPPSQKGLSEWLHNMTLDMRQKRRDQIFETDKEDLVEVSEKYLRREGSLVIFGSDRDLQLPGDASPEEVAALQEAHYSKNFPGWTVRHLETAQAGEMEEEEEE